MSVSLALSAIATVIFGIFFFTHLGLYLFDLRTRRIWSVWNWGYTLVFGFFFVVSTIAFVNQA